MYDISDIRTAFSHPYKIGRELNLLYHRRFRTRDCNLDGEDFLDKDWDNLILLDACRYDKFAKLCDLPGDLSAATSLASSSDEFVRTNFAGKELYDTVILTANSWYYKFDVDAHRLIDFRDEYPNVWPTPDKFTQFVTEHIEEFNDKRIVIHYMTPHSPYLGRVGRRYLHRDTVSSARDIRYVIEDSEYDATVDHLEQAYEENIEIALDEVRKLFNVLEGKTVVTADHGEMLGERQYPFPMRGYQHHHGIYVDELTEVPWLTYTNGPRREIVAEEPDSERESDVDTDVVNDRLRNLGYIDVEPE